MIKFKDKELQTIFQKESNEELGFEKVYEHLLEKYRNIYFSDTLVNKAIIHNHTFYKDGELNYIEVKVTYGDSC